MSVQEIIYYQDDRVLITNTRAVLGGTTYPLSNIGSVTAVEKPPDKKSGTSLITVGGLLGFGCACFSLISTSTMGNDPLSNGMLCTIPSSIVGFLILIVGYSRNKAAKPDYAVLIGSAAGESPAYVSKDKKYIVTIVTAINEAIINRG
jgi:hypothetical protein